MMKKLHIIIAAVVAVLCLPAIDVQAQAIEIPEGYELVDSLVYRINSPVDSSLVGVNIFDIMPSHQRGDDGNVTVNQSAEVASSMRNYISSNSTRELTGYRVRIFFGNHRTARMDSEAVLEKFSQLYHDTPAYRTYVNPYFKVTVGDFRTKSEAMALLERIKGDFPSAFVLKETISFPVVDKDNAYVVDTVKVLRPKVSSL